VSAEGRHRRWDTQRNQDFTLTQEGLAWARAKIFHWHLAATARAGNNIEGLSSSLALWYKELCPMSIHHQSAGLITRGPYKNSTNGFRRKRNVSHTFSDFVGQMVSDALNVMGIRAGKWQPDWFVVQNANKKPRSLQGQYFMGQEGL